MPIQLISYLQDTGFDLYNMREWLSGGAPPCQGGGRGFDPRLALEKRTIPNRYRSFFRALPGLESSMSTLRSGPRSPRSPGPRAPSRACLHGKFQKQKVLRICFGSYRSFILYAHVRGTRLYWAGPYRWGGGRGGFSVQVR